MLYVGRGRRGTYDAFELLGPGLQVCNESSRRSPSSQKPSGHSNLKLNSFEVSVWGTNVPIKYISSSLSPSSFLTHVKKVIG